MARNGALSVIIFLAVILVLLPSYAFSEEFDLRGPEGSVGDWTIVESSYATIFVDKEIDLRSVTRRINVNFARYDPIEKKLFLDKNVSDSGQLANKIDIMTRRAKNILDMHPQGMHVNIRIYKSDQKLWNIYADIFKEERTHKAFYIHKFRTIYISLPNVSESVLAHEIGHSIIDNYFAILPPMKIRELLAAYVDAHLKD